MPSEPTTIHWIAGFYFAGFVAFMLTLLRGELPFRSRALRVALFGSALWPIGLVVILGMVSWVIFKTKVDGRSLADLER